MNITQKKIYLNADTKKRVGLINGIPSTVFIGNDEIYEGDTFAYCVEVVDNEGEAVSVGDGDFYLLISDGANAVSETFNAGFNKDWAEIDLSEGKISIRVSVSEVGTTGDVMAELWHRAVGYNWTLISRWGIDLIETYANESSLESDMSSESTLSSESSSSESSSS